MTGGLPLGKPGTAIIRNVVTMDRGVKLSNGHLVTVTTEEVIAAIGSMENRWTTHDVARALDVRERAVRAIIAALCRMNQVRKIEGEGIIRITATSKKEYAAALYEYVPRGGPADFEALNRILLRV